MEIRDMLQTIWMKIPHTALRVHLLILCVRVIGN
jgi:hypothetical protein